MMDVIYFGTPIIGNNLPLYIFILYICAGYCDQDVTNVLGYIFFLCFGDMIVKECNMH